MEEDVEESVASIAVVILLDGNTVDAGVADEVGGVVEETIVASVGIHRDAELVHCIRITNEQIVPHDSIKKLGLR